MSDRGEMQPDDTQHPASRKANLYLAIDGTYYKVESIPSEAPGRPRGWRLTKGDDAEAKSPYCVMRHDSGELTCTCPDWIVRHQRLRTDCKHIVSLIAVGLLKGRGK